MKKISEITVLVVGDIMLDRYIVGDVTRVSPEAPVPVVNASHEYFRLGGCGNVYKNIMSIGAGARCITALGSDRAGDDISKRIGDSIVITDDYIETIQKIRIVSNHRQTQMLRVDKESRKIKMDEEAIKYIAHANIKPFDIIIVSDYGKGMINKGLMNYLKALNTPIIVDPKPINSGYYNGVFMITPNEKEYVQMMSYLGYIPKANYILQTAGKEGMFLDDLKKNVSKHIKSVKTSDVYNVTGAGDTVIAVVSVCIALGITPLASSKIANQCASYVVTKPGTTSVPKDIFQKALKRFYRPKKKSS